MRSLHQYWNWWISQLSDALPTLSTVRKRAAIIAYLQEDMLYLRVRDEPHTPLGTVTPDMTDQERRAIHRKMATSGVGNRQVVLSVPEEARLQRTVELPLAAEAHLNAVAGNELDRWTPWRTDQAVFSISILQRSASSGKLVAEVSAVPRAAFARAQESLQRADLSLIGLLFERSGQSSEFIELESDFRPLRRRNSVSRIAAAAFAGLLVLSVLGAFGYKIWAIRSLEDHMAPLVRGAEETQKLAAELQQLARVANYAVDIKRERPSAIITLNVLSRILPDDCWLESLSLEGDRLTIQGNATDALTLLPLLTASGLLQEVAFASEVARDPDAGVDRFSITAKVIPHVGP
jgi:general secretion pathway protein L